MTPHRPVRADHQTSVKRTTSALLAVATATVLAVSGCAMGAEVVQAKSDVVDAPAHEVPLPPAATAEAAPVTPAVGATVATDEEVAAAQGAGLGVYVTTAGARVVIDPTAPAPQVILDDARATGAGSVSPPNYTLQDAQGRGVLDVGARAQAAGKALVFVIASGQYGASGELVRPMYGVVSSAPDLKGRALVETHAEAVRVAQARIAAHPYPTLLEVIDLTR